jgi:phage terminase large subunit
MLTFVRNEKMRAEAEEGAHDDCIMSLAIAHFIRPQQKMVKEVKQAEPTAVWSDDMWEDYYNADEESRRYLISKWGEPKR